MADAVTIIAIVGGAVGTVGGVSGLAALVTAVVALRRERREHTLTVWESYDRQIKSAEARGDEAEVLRLRLEQEGQHEAWRAQQRLGKIAPREISAARAGPSLTEEEVAKLRALLAEAQPLSPALLSAEEYFLRGNAYYGAGEYENALAAYNRSLELTPDQPATLDNRGITLSRLGRYEQALADCNRSLELRPDEPATLCNRGVMLHQMGRYEEALADYNRALELRPDHPVTLNNRAVLLARRGHHEDALRDIDRALLVKPLDPLFRSTRAEILHRQGNATGAEAELDRAVAEAADKADAHYAVAEAWSVLGGLAVAYSNLCEAVAGKQTLRARARHDPEFDNLRHDSEYGRRFRALVGEEEPPPEAEDSA